MHIDTDSEFVGLNKGERGGEDGERQKGMHCAKKVVGIWRCNWEMHSMYL